VHHHNRCGRFEAGRAQSIHNARIRSGIDRHHDRITRAVGHADAKWRE
jgi:hypothetical protein